MQHRKIAEGDTIRYRVTGGGVRRVRVTSASEDIKNGRPGFDGVVLDGAEAGKEIWGYTDQIIEAGEADEIGGGWRLGTPSAPGRKPGSKRRAW